MAFLFLPLRFPSADRLALALRSTQAFVPFAFSSLLFGASSLELVGQLGQSRRPLVELLLLLLELKLSFLLFHPAAALAFVEVGQCGVEFFLLAAKLVVALDQTSSELGQLGTIQEADVGRIG